MEDSNLWGENIGFNSPTASDGLFLSIILALLVRMEYVYKRLPLTYLKHLLFGKYHQ
jgi:hypothetical protein